MSDLISRSALIEVVEADINRCYILGIGGVGALSHFIDQIKEQPTVEAKPVVHGEWLEARMDYVCSRCKTEFHDDIEWIQGEHKLPNFCPECGADMRKEVQK